MNNRFNFRDTQLQGLRIIERKPMGDKRGYLERLYSEDEFTELLPGEKITQINQTRTNQRGTVRGMHFQYPPHSEIKIISCLEGEVFDVAVDLRSDSPTFLQWHCEILSSDIGKSLLVPEGFAHGFQTLSENCKMLYFHTSNYNQAAEGGVLATDSKLKIEWPLPFTYISDRDMSYAPIDSNFRGIDKWNVDTAETN